MDSQIRYSLVVPVLNEEAALPLLFARLNALFDKLGLPPATHHHRRVLAVLSYLDHR